MNSKPRAIIADDEPHLAQFLKDRLTALWPELEVLAVAANGPEALRLIDDHVPDMVFLDIRMPGLTGLEVAGRIDAKTRIVFVTAFDQYAVDAFEREAVDYLLKPVSDERLQKTIARLKDKTAGAELPQDVNVLMKTLARVLPSAKAAHLRWIRAAVGELTRQIPIEEVLYFQAQDKYVSVYTRR
jgi:DNA-binding LytR/AlgR family response regulator